MIRFGHKILIVTFYAGFLLSSGLFCYNYFTFADIRNWPSVPAVEIRVSEQNIPIIVESHMGSRKGSRDLQFVSYKYQVNGDILSGSLVNPDGGGRLPKNVPGRPLMVYYHPNSPDISVLVPRPYRGNAYIMTMGLTGVFVLIHLFTWRRDHLPLTDI